MIESTRSAYGACAIDRCEIITAHGPGVASDLLRGGLGGPGLGLDVLDDCAPSAALLLLVGHDFGDCEALLATRGAHLPEAETLYVGRWKGGVRTHWSEGTLGAELARLGQVEDGGGRETVLLAGSRRLWSVSVPLTAVSQLSIFFKLKHPPVTAIGV